MIDEEDLDEPVLANFEISITKSIKIPEYLQTCVFNEFSLISLLLTKLLKFTVQT